MATDEALTIRIDDPGRPEIAALLEEHLACMVESTPEPESRHALDVDGLRKPEITFWSVWRGNALAGCGALKDLGAGHAEIKSMKTVTRGLRRGTAAALMTHLLAEARRRGYRRLSLETGSMAYFEPARRLYAKFGFEECAAFPPYRPDPNSTFMTLAL